MSIISNFKNSAKNDLRRKALEIAEAGYEAIEIKKAVSEKIKLKDNKLKIKIVHSNPADGGIGMNNTEKEVNLDNYKRIFLVGIGKGSAMASATLAKILGDKLIKGIALDVPGKDEKVSQQSMRSHELLTLEILRGTHPLPSKQNVKATQKIIKLAKSLKKDDLLITLICGGGSSLMCGSEKELEASQTVFKELTEAGANIKELNTVRKHLSEVKGGGLAKFAYPATIISLIVSDVCGNDLSFVSSGPTVFDKTTNKDAKDIFKKYGFEHKNFHFHENPREKRYFKKVKNILFVCNQDAIMAMLGKAEELGFSVKIYSLALQGEAMNALLPMIRMAKSGQAIIAAGETTVNLKNRLKGKGGRNMEAVLGALTQINADKNTDKHGYNLRQSVLKSASICVLSFTSDGRDNTEAAGAIGDGLTLQKAKKLKMSPIEFLEQNKSFAFFDKIGDLIFAEKKCFNVADLMIVLKL